MADFGALLRGKQFSEDIAEGAQSSIGLRRFEFRAIALESTPAYLEGMKKKLSPYDLPQSNDNPMRSLLRK